MSPQKNPAKRLKLLRKSLLMSQSEMAQELCMEQSTYSKVECGKTQLSFSSISLISKKFNISPNEFFEVTIDEIKRNEKPTVGDTSYYLIPIELVDKLIEILNEITFLRDSKQS